MAQTKQVKCGCNRQHMTYDFFAEEWSGQCGACGTWLYAPNKGAYLLQYSLHTHSDKCLGGY